jgi:hypothetical protein
MTPRSALTHLRRYPKWYAVAVVWVLAMAIVPVVKQPVAHLAERTRARAVDAVAAPLAPAAEPLPPGSDDVLPPSPVLPGVPALPPPPTAKPTPSPQPQPAPAGLTLPALPALPIPAPPKQLDPLFAALAPLTTTGCSGIGLAAVVIAVVAPTVDQVPLDQLLPYLVPAYTVCALFPLPKAHTVCPLDDQVAAQLPDDITSLTEPPTIIGVGIDVIAGMEAAASQMAGVPLMGYADSLRTQLGCHVV